MPQESFKTDDMALATYLCLSGHKYQRMQRDGRKIHWVFARADGLADLVADYASGDATCEPRAFMLRVAEVRQEMYGVLDGATG